MILSPSTIPPHWGAATAQCTFLLEKEIAMSEKKYNAAVFGSDVKRLPLKDLLKRIGPGLIATGIVIGPGAVTTASMLGAAMIWCGCSSPSCSWESHSC